MALETSRQPVQQSIGNYDLLEKIAEGGMGAIYKGRRRDDGLLVAIKIMPAHMTSNKTLLKRFEQEFRAASRLDHPNIVRALDYSDTGSAPYLVMEFVDGKSLGQMLEDQGNKPLPENDAIKIIAQVAQGLHRAHKQGLIHRDVKPDNILITKDSTGGLLAKLADLGLVKETETDLNLTKTGRGLGTPHFMAPEQFRNAKAADPRCDIYSLGATLYQMVTGELPFRSNGPLDAWMKKMNGDLKPPRQLNPEISERIEWAIQRAMSSDPEVRPLTCREFVEDLTGRSTRRSLTQEIAASAEMWYLVYKDEFNLPHTVKGTTSAIRRSLKEGLLGDASNVLAGRSKAGPFEPLRSFPEFRDLVINATPQTAAAVSPSTVAPGGPSSSARIRSTATPVAGGDRATRRPATVRPVSTPASTTAPAEADQPHIALGRKAKDAEDQEDSGEWVKWVFLLFLGLASAAATYFFLHMPK